MNRDKLESNLDNYIASAEIMDLAITAKIATALRAVLELHKSIPPEEGFESMHITYCQGCSIIEIVDWATCPTIQAIEKVFE
jgi:hypothetical protein